MRNSDKIEQVLYILDDLVDTDEVLSNSFEEYLSKREVEDLQAALEDLDAYFISKGL